MASTFKGSTLMPLLETMNLSSLLELTQKMNLWDSSKFYSISIVQKSNASDLGDQSSYENVLADHQGRVRQWI